MSITGKNWIVYISDNEEGFQALPEDIQTEIFAQLKHNVENGICTYVAGSLCMRIGNQDFMLHVRDIFCKKTEYDVELQYWISKSYVKFKKPSGHFYPTALKNIEIFESMDIETIINYGCL
jgi:hypothetical protein